MCLYVVVLVVRWHHLLMPSILMPRLLPIRHHQLSRAVLNLHTSVLLELWRHVLWPLALVLVPLVGSLHVECPVSVMIDLLVAIILKLNRLSISFSKPMFLIYRSLSLLIILNLMIMVVLYVDDCWAVVDMHVADIVRLACGGLARPCLAVGVRREFSVAIWWWVLLGAKHLLLLAIASEWTLRVVELSIYLLLLVLHDACSGRSGIAQSAEACPMAPSASVAPHQVLVGQVWWR